MPAALSPSTPTVNAVTSCNIGAAVMAQSIVPGKEDPTAVVVVLIKTVHNNLVWRTKAPDITHMYAGAGSFIDLINSPIISRTQFKPLTTQVEAGTICCAE